MSTITGYPLSSVRGARAGAARRGLQLLSEPRIRRGLRFLSEPRIRRVRPTPESVVWVDDPHDGLKSTLRRERADEARGVQLAQGAVLDEALGQQRGGVLRADGAQDRPHTLRRR